MGQNRYDPNKTETVTDTSKRDAFVEQNAEKEGYSAWIDGLLENLIEKKGIFNGKDMFYPSGKRRSWEQRHYEYNLENIVRAMYSTQEAQGAGFFGNNLFGSSAQKYDSVDAIRSDKDRLRTIDDEAYENLKSEYVQRLGNIADMFARDRNDWQNREAASDLLLEAVMKRRTRDGIAAYLKNEGAGWTRYSDAVVDSLVSLVEDVRKMPTGYFEAKPARPVYAEEIKGVVLPESSDTKLLDALDARGISYLTYENKNDADRINKVNQLADEKQVKFSQRNNYTNTSLIDLYSEKQYNDYGWARVNDVLTATENKTLRSVMMAIKTGKETHHPVTRYGEHVILLGNNKDYTKIVYVKGTVENPIITKVFSGDSFVLKEVEELEGIRSRYASEIAEIYEEAGYVEKAVPGNYPSYSESKRRGTGFERTSASNFANREIGAESAGNDSGTVKSSLRDQSAVSDRELLSGALMEAAQTEDERARLRRYQKYVETLDNMQADLQEINDQVKALSKSKEPGDRAKEKALRQQGENLANRINNYDLRHKRFHKEKTDRKAAAAPVAYRSRRCCNAHSDIRRPAQKNDCGLSLPSVAEKMQNYTKAVAFVCKSCILESKEQAGRQEREGNRFAPRSGIGVYAPIRNRRKRMGKMKRFKKCVCLVCAVLFLLPLLSVGAQGAGQKRTPFTFSAAPQKEAYEKGEEIRIDAVLKNTGYADFRNCTVTMHYSATDTYLAAGTVEQTVEEVEYGGVWNVYFTLYENTDAMSAGEKLPAALRLLAALLKRAVYLVSQFTPLFEYMKARTEVVTEEFPRQLGLLFTPRVTYPAGGCTVFYDGKPVECSFFVRFDLPVGAAPLPAARVGTAETDFCLTAEVTPSLCGIETLTFGGVYENGGYTGGLVCFDGVTGRVGVSRATENGTEQLAFRLTELTAGKPCRVKLNYEGGRLKLWGYTNPLDPDPYPLFDIEAAFPGRDYGCSRGVAGLLAAAAEPMAYDGPTYTNPVCDNAPDPQILFDGGVYYLYATNSPDGYEVYTSTDLVHWSYGCKAARAEDLIGDHWYWAPEVYRYRDRYYLLYTSHLGDEIGLGVAVADSPMGPFVKTGEDYIVDLPSLDGTFFFDDDGKIYLYFSVVDHGQSLWGCEMNEDLCSIKPETLTRLSAPEGWEKSINEGPAMLKHNGVYYLTYSGDGYDSVNYGVGYMTSTEPLGAFTKSPLNPVLKYTAYLHGPGHHCFVLSPDGSELFICYHSHYSTTQVHQRRMNIDRVKFVPTESGIDALVIYGPTVTPQPMPR